MTTEQMLAHMAATIDDVIIRCDDGVYTISVGFYRGRGTSVGEALTDVWQKLS